MSPHINPEPAQGESNLQLRLFAALPGQLEAKAVLVNEMSVFLAPRESAALKARPVMLFGRQMGTIPERLARALADQAALPMITVECGAGISVEQILTGLAARSAGVADSGPVGVALLLGLEWLSEDQCRALAARLRSSELTPCLIRGCRRDLDADQVFWIGAHELAPCVRPATVDQTEFHSVSWVGSSSHGTGPLVTAIAAGKMSRDLDCRAVSPAFPALSSFFRSEALILPATGEDLREWALAESAPWWPGQQMRGFCERHGVRLLLDEQAATAWAAESARAGLSLDHMEECLRAVMHPLLALIADQTVLIEAVAPSAACFEGRGSPRLVPGNRQTPAMGGSIPVEGDTLWLPDRPERTPHSPPSVRLACARDIESVIAPTANLPRTP